MFQSMTSELPGQTGVGRVADEEIQRNGTVLLPEVRISAGLMDRGDKLCRSLMMLMVCNRST